MWILTDRDAENVRLQLHQQPVGRHSSVHLELSQRDAAVLVHGVQDLHTNTHIFFFLKQQFCDLHSDQTCQLEAELTSRVWKQTASRAANARWLLFVNWVNPQMILWHRGRRVSARNHFRPVSCRTGSVSVLPSRTGLPVRCIKTRKRRNKVTTVGCSDWCGQLLCTGRQTLSISSQIFYRLNDTTSDSSSKRTELFWRSDDPEVVLQPTDHSSRDGHRALQGKRRKNVPVKWKIRNDRKKGTWVYSGRRTSSA